MDVIFMVVIFSIVVPAVLGSFAFFYFGGLRVRPIEYEAKLFFQEQCGGRFNGFCLTIPFVRHAIYDDFIVTAYGRSYYVLKLSEISRVEKKWYSNKLVYHHQNKELPVEFIIWSKSPRKVLALLESKNVNVQKNS